MAYIIGKESLIQIIIEPVSEHFAGFATIWIFAFVFYLVFSRMRELVCTVVCPYGRLQSVLLDNKSIIVAYDYNRGEPRSKIQKGQSVVAGDCIDCKLCVQVCPTGIDIRNGTQLECVNCTACIDACDMVMHKIGRPERLIGFKSETEIKTKSPFRVSRKIYAYSTILVLLLAILSSLLIGRTEVQTTILRASGTLYQMRDAEGTVSNLYTAEMVNKTNHALSFSVVPEIENAVIQYIERPATLAYGKSVKTTFFVILPQQDISHYKTRIAFKLVSDQKVIDRFETTFIAPPK